MEQQTGSTRVELLDDRVSDRKREAIYHEL